MARAIVFHEFLSRVVQLFKLFCLKHLKIDLNTVPKIVIFDICRYVLMEPVYCVFVENIMVRYLNIYGVSKKDF